tara:strand:+ start:37492 stop:38481 length:990 start_codon:yes stop_codon:yes gene_type:complete
MSDIPRVSVRCRYYKRPAAFAVLDHAHHKRNGFTNSQNVNPEFTHNNTGFYYHGANSCAEALEILCEKHKKIMGKKVRADNNILFEHVVCWSEQQYKKLESKFSPARVKKAIITKLKSYAQTIKTQFGFEPLGIDLHLDEGWYSTSPTEPKAKKFIRNIHAHVMFFNFDFSPEKLLAPLRHLMKKGTDNNGQTLKLNPNFEKIQNIAHEHFRSWGFSRGLSKNITGEDHLTKESHVQRKLISLREQSAILQNDNEKLKVQLIDKRCEFDEVCNSLKSLTLRMHKLRSQVDEIYTLKKELSLAIQQNSEFALRKIISKAREFRSPTRRRR